MRSSRNQLAHRPGLASDPGRHGRGAPDRRVHPREVVARDEQRDRGAEVLALPAETGGQSGEPASHHPHMEIQALHVRGAHPRLFRIARDDALLGRYYLRRAVASFAVEPAAFETLDDLRVIDSPTEVLLDRGRIAFESVRREL